MTVAFRAASEADVDLLLNQMRALYEEDGTPPFQRDAAEAALRALLATPERGLVWVIERGGENERAQALYRKQGFAERGLRLMTKRLSLAREWR